jgi:glycosyltransferase involved in cell wall biosynthesis
MRVLHATSGNLFGGIEAFLLALARSRVLRPETDPQFAVCFEGRLSEELEVCGAAVHRVGRVRVRRPWTVWRARRRFKELLSRESFDAVACHGCWPHALFAPVVRARRLPLVFWAHDAPKGRHWLEWWARRTRPDLVLANSQWTAAAVPNLFPGVRTEASYLPVPEPAAADRAAIRRRVRSALETAAHAVVILQACRLERWKGQALLLEALTRLAATPGWVCWIAGGAQRPHEEKYLAELRRSAGLGGIAERVRFLGQRSDVPELLAAADIHCQPNTGPEPFGIAFVEALYAGLPVVATELGGAREIVDASCGVLVPPHDPGALQAALRRLIADPVERARLGCAGPTRARMLCDPGAALDRLHLLLRPLAVGGLATETGLPCLSVQS